jgi:hypothetical protein
MKKTKLPLLLLFILLFFNDLCFSQTNISYIDWITENSSKYKTYQKNFNPLKYDPLILKRCFVEMINDLRMRQYSCAPLANLSMLDSVALLQAEYQATQNKMTVENVPPYQYTSQRLQLFGFTVQGDEYVSKGKAHQGNNEYSYYDLCVELLKPMLKNALGTPAFLSPQYTVFGFAAGIEKNMNSVYISLILGNDLTNQVFNSITSKQKDLPITRGLTGLKFYDASICAKCADDNTLEQIYDMLYWDENGNVFLQSNDAKWVNKLLTKAGNAIVLDFIQKEQYNCRVPQVDHNKPYRGIVSKPIMIDKILAANDSTSKSNAFHAKIEKIPDQIELNKAIDINILLLNDKKVVCRTLIKKNVSNISTDDLVADSLIQLQNYDAALYKLAPSLSDSTISESKLFAVVQLAAHKEKTYLSSLFTQAVQMALLRNPQRLCNLLAEFSISVFDNKEVKKIYCNNCK